MTGASDTLKLGGVGSAKTDTRIVLTVQAPPGSPDRLEELWRGRTWEIWDGREWKSAGRVPRKRGAVSFAEADGSERRWRVEVLPAAATAQVFLPGVPVRLDGLRRVPAILVGGWVAQTFAIDSTGNVRVDPPPAQGFAYDVQARTAPVPARGGGRALPPELVARLQLPAELDPRIPALARRLTARAADPVEKVEALQQFLSTFRYTTELPGDVPDPLAHFLFERKAGHCEFFATALAVLARSAGVPARVATGFYGGVRLEEDVWAVRGGDAHAWTEIWFQGVGFVPFDPTPPQGRAAAPGFILEWLSDAWHRLNVRWQRDVVDYSLRDQIRAVVSALSSVRGLSPRSGAGAGVPLRLALAAALLIAALVVARRLWRPRAASAPRRTLERPEVTKAWRMLVRQLRRRGVERVRGQTPRELCEQLAREGRTEAAAVSAFTERYLAARFGPEPPASEVKRLVQDARAI